METMSEAEYKSILKLVDFMIDMLPAGYTPPSIDVLCRLIARYEKYNCIDASED